MKESALVASLLAIAREAGAYAQKNHGSPLQRRGRPDIEGCYWGRFFAWEVKVPGGKATELHKATELQEHCLAQIREAGAFAAVVTSTEQAKLFFRYFPYLCRKCLLPYTAQRLCAQCGYPGEELDARRRD